MKPYQHFTLTERESLAEKIKKGKSNNQIAKEMGRHRSTIGREIKRNYSKKANHYNNAWHGTCLYIERRHKSVRKPTIKSGTDLYNYIFKCLSEYWPPETIAHMCHEKGVSIAMTTIYNAVRNAIKKSFELSEIKLQPKTITLDNGSEFAQFKSIEDDFKTTIYFADTHSPWQRGTNENTNDILRFYLPKGMDFTKVSLGNVQTVVNSINNRP